MENEIFKLAMQQGLWAALFVALLFFVLKENSNRENKYQDIISKLTEKFESIDQGVNSIKDELKEVKEKISK